MYSLYIGDPDEKELLEWLCENLGPVILTTKQQDEYYESYHGENWTMDTTEVSDVSLQYDIICQVRISKKEEAMLTKLRWGGTISETL